VRVKARQLEQPRGKLHYCAHSQRLSLISRHRDGSASRSLLRDPSTLPVCERLSLLLRATPRDGDADTPIDVDPQHVAARAPVPHEVQLHVCK